MEFAPFYPLLYRLLKPAFPGCLWSGSSASRAIALTFDDGPHPQYTPALLRVLDRYQIEASFFWLGACVERYPSLAREVYQRGHWIGLHGYDHRSFPWLSADDLRKSLCKTQTIIANACDVEPEKIRDVRPPNGLFTPQVLQQLYRENYRVVMWSVVPEDWVCPGLTVVRDRVINQIHNGALVVLHDGYCGGEAVAAIAADLLPRLLEKGYQFVTVNDLWRAKVANNSILAEGVSDM